MKLLYQTHSPYARKVLVAAHELGLQHRLEVMHHDTSPTRRNDEVFGLNPLGKVPVLIVDDDLALFDSSVICEYLDGLHSGAKLIPTEHGGRYRALRRQALALGMADAGIAARWESERRPEASRWPPMLQGQLEKIAAACDFLEQEIGEATVTETVPDIGDIALATTLSWIAFRNVYPFAAGRPRLSSWYNRFSARPSMQATTLVGDTCD
ncbi:glutathione S-transferase family protein [Rhodanobacter sp. FDAARGOS 1247]|uniref:glutathione S-transferase family protein n=1 Tax=Rhodanobacter sp. FDAARGOS 1247 TaxID=2778082 RepID=UPI00194E57BF|nr:glutathione S-transferase family protein [Rhodanobacter sp. FDAARGOS 1247]QRP62343.1 glutathione S-transferase family protein [Rhodanobacter sp. FDAARGOS 1247]